MDSQKCKISFTFIDAHFYFTQSLLNDFLLIDSFLLFNNGLTFTPNLIEVEGGKTFSTKRVFQLGGKKITLYGNWRWVVYNFSLNL
jgi:hypothetical protein